MASITPSPAGTLPPFVCASHREPFEWRASGGHRRLVRTTGGLVSALDPALRLLGGTWVSTGRTGLARAPTDADGRSYRLHEVEVSPREQEAYYEGFSNRVLWPLLHYFVGGVRFDGGEWAQYVRINSRFAAELAEALTEEPVDAVAWVHDYHLLLVPQLLRQRQPGRRIGLFLHVPFPSFEVFRVLPTRRELLEGMLGADVVGFHTHAYRDAFCESARRLLGARVEDSVVEHRRHHTRTLVAPIGVDVARLTALATEPSVQARARLLRRRMSGERLLLGIDRLDYSKGLLERLDGLRRLLETHPEHRGRVTLLQLAVPSRVRVEEYRALKRQLDEAVGRLSGRYGDAGWSPVRYVNRALQEPELAAWYLAADVALVTPLRDGLNLVAKEYVATRADHGGALVLSEFAGVAEELPQAWLVNPFGADSVAAGLHEALTIGGRERERRMAALRGRVVANDIGAWATRFVAQIAGREASPPLPDGQHHTRRT